MEFEKTKDTLIKQWEDAHGVEWPRYTEDVYITTKSGQVVLVRKKGQRYDAHHVEPLSAGGKNSASNITPLHYNDHRAIHSKDGKCDRYVKAVESL